MIVDLDKFDENDLIDFDEIRIKVEGAIITGVNGLDHKLFDGSNNKKTTLKELLLSMGAKEHNLPSANIDEEIDDRKKQVREIICPTCSTQNIYNAITCSICGTNLNSKPNPIQYVCSECQTGISPGTRFCAMCGVLFSKVQCRSCHILNPRESDQCYSCRTPLPLLAAAHHSDPPSKVAKPSILCLACGVLNSVDSRFCKDCNHELKKAVEKNCAQCGRPTKLGATYCGNCEISLRQRIGPLQRPINSPRQLEKVKRQTPTVSQVLPNFYIKLVDGSLLAGRYRILQMYARGGFRVVYLAEDIQQNSRHCIVKDTLGDLQSEIIKMLQREMDLLFELNHPGLPQAYDTITQNGQWYAVVEYVEGQTLKQLLEAANIPIPELKVARWAIQICDILAYLHNQNPPVIVRDIKPDNLILRKHDNQVVLIDLSANRTYQTKKIKDTMALATNGYAPPEQYGKSQTNSRADIYGLGATLHHLLTCRHPANQPFNFPPLLEMNPTLNPEWERIIKKATQMEPEQRYQSAAEMKTDLMNLLNSLWDDDPLRPSLAKRFKRLINKLRRKS